MTELRESVQVDLTALLGRMRDAETRLTTGEQRQERLFSRLRETGNQITFMDQQFAVLQRKVQAFAKAQLRQAGAFGLSSAFDGGSFLDSILGSGISGLIAGGPAGAAASIGFALLARGLGEVRDRWREFSKELEDLKKAARDQDRRVTEFFRTQAEARDKREREFMQALSERFRREVAEHLHQAARYWVSPEYATQ